MTIQPLNPNSQIIKRLDQIVTEWEQGGMRAEESIDVIRTVNTLMYGRLYRDIPNALRLRIVQLSRVYEESSYLKALQRRLGYE